MFQENRLIFGGEIEWFDELFLKVSCHELTGMAVCQVLEHVTHWWLSKAAYGTIG